MNAIVNKVRYMKIRLFLLFILSSCSANVLSCNDHPWGNSPPRSSDYDLLRSNAIDSLVYPIKHKEQILTAKENLEEREILEISEEDAAKYLGRTIVKKEKHRIFLIRALKGGVSANIEVYLYNGILYFESVTMGEYKHVIESPLIVLLEKAPQKIYIVCIGVN